MGLKMSYTPATKAVAPESYSKVVKSAPICPVGGSDAHEVEAQMFQSQADRDATPPAAPIKTVYYRVSGAEYDTFFALSVLDQAGNNPIKQAYAFLKAHVPTSGFLMVDEPDFRNATDA